ncbi:hypothetical protein EDC19_0897 [Natranaerovirga hydrolytica]|uniref:DUF4352 domain-containing protein n=1 Tax=Natranaerovirga hydrolytica TaxID=680378 RepID=A0A4R1MZ79_9FIRM|nr:hypothetical protein [Natranaerovirga hydrolytica]TCK98475.1 hypothetical protein EDC19_0897 [Natranaerovirga hydrolytica]
MKKALLLVMILLLTGCSNELDSSYEIMGETLSELILKHYNNELYEEVPEVPGEIGVEGNYNELLIEESVETSTIQKIKGMTFTYKSMDKAQRFKDYYVDEIGVYIDSLDGMQFLAINLEVENTSGDVISAEHFINNLSVKLIVDNEYLYSPLKSLLEKDLTSIKKDIEDGEAIEGFFLFHLHDSIVIDEINEMNLILSRDNNSEIIRIQ